MDKDKLVFLKRQGMLVLKYMGTFSDYLSALLMQGNDTIQYNFAISLSMYIFCIVHRHIMNVNLLVHVVFAAFAIYPDAHAEQVKMSVLLFSSQVSQFAIAHTINKTEIFFNLSLIR